MYAHHIEPFGPFTRHILAQESGSPSFAVIPELGAALQSLRFEGVEVLDSDQTPEEADANRWSKGRLLFPFPNRLQDGAYTWEGRSYQFPLNDPGTGNALHGFGLNKPFEVEAAELGAESGALICSYAYDGSLEAYPFPFIFEAVYELSGPQFSVTLRCHNTGDTPIPFGFGWHPYFRLDDESADRMSLQLPALDMVGIDERMIPTGKFYPYDEFAVLRPLGATVLDNCFRATVDGPELRLTLAGSRGKLHYWHELGPGKYPFLQVFTPPHRQSVAIEPMSCNVDAFHNGQGLLRLLPGERAEARCGLRYEAPQTDLDGL